MSPESTAADVSDFQAVDGAPDPAAVIAMLDSLQPLHRKARLLLLDRLSPETARTALDVGCGPATDTIEMAGRMPPGSAVEGVDTSEAMLAEAHRRAAAAGAAVTFRAGSALSLPYPDAAFDICRVKTVLQYVPDPLLAIREMARVTRPGGKVGAFEIDLGSVVVDHPNLRLRRLILDAFCEPLAQPWVGRQLQRLFRDAGLINLTVDPVAYLASHASLRAMSGPVVARLRDNGQLSSAQSDEWWSWLDSQDQAGGYTFGATVFVVTGTRPR